MSSPVATVADALIAFILSLLHDPDAVAEFAADPQGSMHNAGVQNACMADLKAVAPVVVDHPNVTPKPPGPPPPPHPDPVVNEIIRMTQQFTIDNRSTIIDQSVNQNIWTNGGDVTQLFDQDAVVASGDDAVAAGDDATLTNTDTDITIDDSFNDTEDSSDNSSVDDSFQDNSQNDSSSNGTVDDSFQDNSTDVDVEDNNIDSPFSSNDVDVSASVVVVPTAAPPAEEPADVLESDMTAVASEAYVDDSASALVTDEPLLEELTEEQ